MPTSYHVIRDTREQENQGWFFDKTAICSGMSTQTLKTGDYTLQNYEHLLCLERKRNTAEFATNITESRFERELERLEAFQFPFIICEFSLEQVLQFPVNSGIPKPMWKKIKITPQYMLKRINEFHIKYKTRIIFASNSETAKAFVLSLFKRVIEHVEI